MLWELDDARRLLNQVSLVYLGFLPARARGASPLLESRFPINPFQEYVPERSVAQVIGRLTRVGEIFRLLVDQFTILETMSPLGFLEFRDYLFPASGFQSLQWRKVRNSEMRRPRVRFSCCEGLLSEMRKSIAPLWS